MISNQPQAIEAPLEPNRGERGAALVMAIIIMALLAGVSICTLAVVSNEAKVAGSDLQRTQTFYAASAGMEKMSNGFSALFSRTTKPTQQQLNAVAANYPTELLNEGYRFTQSLTEDTDTLAELRQAQGIVAPAFPTVGIQSGPYTGLLASVVPYKMSSTATRFDGTEVKLEREMNNYLIPLFQFGMFSDKDIELHPGPPFTFNGRIHTNGNLYLNGNVMMLDKVTTANEVVYDVLRNNSERDDANVNMRVNGITVRLTMGSVNDGPNFPGVNPGARGFHIGSPNGTNNSTWKNKSIAAASNNTSNQFGGQLLTRSTGAVPLLLPLQLGGNTTRELIKRAVAGEELIDTVLNESRYQTKAQIRIIIDDESMAGDASGIPAGQGLLLSTFNPQALDGGNALRVVGDNGQYVTDLNWLQGNPAFGLPALTVRGVRNDYSIWTSNAAHLNATANDAHHDNNSDVPRGAPGGAFIPPGAGIRGRILIQIVAPDGITTRDVTREILSMGMTEGEPNGIVYLQRPLWAAFMQGSRDRDGGNENLEYLTHNAASRCIADGEINSNNFSVDGNGGYYNTSANNTDDDPHLAGAPHMPTTFSRNDKIPANSMNRIVPINVYNPREGWIDSALDERNIFERGMTSVIEINMRNLARWVDGVYDGNLLRGTSAISANIGSGNNGYVVYISDRRGDRLKGELDRNGSPIQSTNGTVDNEDIYGPNGRLDPGEDVLDNGANLNTLQKDTAELPDPTGGTIWAAGGSRRNRAEAVQSWTNPNNYFRRAVRIFNGSNLQISGAAGRLSQTKGITISSENMVYIWGSYNTTGIAAAPAAGTSTLNNGGYLGPQIPSSIVADAIFPLSRTWSDSMSSYNPEGGNAGNAMRVADAGVVAPGQETSVRAGIIAGTNMSALSGNPDAGNGNDSRLSGGMHNFPRFLENWLTPQRRWNFVGSFCPLFYSTQALGPWIYLNQQIYGAPQRNWAFDTSFRTPTQLPPGTPLFQYIEPTGFRQVYQ
jgi:hypothetical protein